MAAQDDHDDTIDDDDLIAYLDGELDASAAAEVEARLARDPATRLRAEAYRKTFELLDHLPSPEPDPTFASRTLTRLQPVIASGSAENSTAAVVNRGSPFDSQTDNTRRLDSQAGSRAWRPLLLTMLGLIVAGAVGYFAHAAIDSFKNRDAELSAADVAIFERLPLYLGVDDLEFIRKLEESELFEPRLADGAEPAPVIEAEDPAGPSTDNPPITSPTASGRQKLAELFTNFPTVRQQQIRTLHQQIEETEPAQRQRWLAVLARYSLWLNRLSENDRRDILTATPGSRVDVIEQVFERLWRTSLSPAQQEMLRKAPVVERQELATVLRARQQSWRAEWVLARRQWQQMSGRDQKPWPFSDPTLAKQIDDYVRNVLGADLALSRKSDWPASCRLTVEEVRDLRTSHEAAVKDGYWLSYGACLLRLAESHPSLPRSAREVIVRRDQLSEEWKKTLAKETRKNRLDFLKDRWPDFALEVHRIVPRPDLRTPLGPAKPGEFEDAFEKFLTEKLFPVLSEDQKKRLALSEGKWPGYSQDLLTMAREKNLCVPGVTLPGEPKQWDKFYRIQSPKK